MYGYSENEARKMNIKDIVPEHKQKEATAFIKELQIQEVESFVTERLTKYGKTVDVWLTVTKLVDEDGKPFAAATTERDITKFSPSLLKRYGTNPRVKALSPGRILKRPMNDCVANSSFVSVSTVYI